MKNLIVVLILCASCGQVGSGGSDKAKVDSPPQTTPVNNIIEHEAVDTEYNGVHAGQEQQTKMQQAQQQIQQQVQIQQKV